VKLGEEGLLVRRGAVKLSALFVPRSYRC